MKDENDIESYSKWVLLFYRTIPFMAFSAIILLSNWMYVQKKQYTLSE